MTKAGFNGAAGRRRTTFQLTSILLLVTCLAAALPREGRAQSAGSAVSTLTPGRTVEVELGGGETHSYGVRLEAGQYFKLVVEQKGVDLLVTLLSPGGEKLAEVDAPTGEYGPEHLSHVTNGPGTYALRVSALAKDAPKGKYSAVLSEPRAADEADRKRVAAERLYNEGQALSLTQMPESVRAAAAKFEQARELLRAAADPRAAAEVVSSLAVVHYKLGDMARAVEFLDQEAPLRLAAGDRRGLAVTFNSRGIIAHQKGDYQQALERFEQALAVYAEIGDRYEESNALNNLGLVYQMLGDTEKALDAHTRALPLRRATNNRSGEVATLHNLGLAYDRLGDFGKALDFYSQSAALARQINHPEQESVPRLLPRPERGGSRPR